MLTGCHGFTQRYVAAELQAARYEIIGLAHDDETVDICLGTAHTLSEVLDMVAMIAGYAIEVRVNPTFVRDNEVKRLVAFGYQMLEVPNRLASATIGGPSASRCLAQRSSREWRPSD